MVSELGRGERVGAAVLGVHRPRDHQGLMGRLAGSAARTEVTGPAGLVLVTESLQEVG